MIPTKEDIERLAAKRAYGAPIVTNYHRSDVVEAMVSYALPDWEWCAGDWAAYDFKHHGHGTSDVRLEVKQTSALQSWGSARPSKPSWDVAPRAGYFEGSEWTSRVGRNADIYILAAHGETDRDLADHRDPSQWRFYVVDAARLPNQKSISEGALLRRRLATATGFESLRREVEALRLQIAEEPGRAPQGSTAESAPA